VNENKGFENYFYTHEYRFNTSYTFTKTETSISLFFKYNGQMQNYQYSLVDNKIILGSIDAYSLLDCSVNKYFLKRKLNVTLGSKNVLNTINVQANLISGPHGNANNSALIGMGRTFFLTMKFNLNILSKK
jgi:outer membrane receptor for ferrienterochelin and colicins